MAVLRQVIRCSSVQEYKPPSSKDIPIDFRVSLLKNAPNPVGVLRSKGAQANFSCSTTTLAWKNDNL